MQSSNPKGDEFNEQSLAAKRDKFQVQIRRASHKKLLRSRREDIEFQIWVEAIEDFLEVSSGPASCGKILQTLTCISTLVAEMDLGDRHFQTINDSYLYAAFNKLLRSTEFTVLIEQVLKIQAVLTGFAEYNVFVDEVEEFCKPLIDAFSSLSFEARCDALWCLSNMLCHKEARKLLELINGVEFIPHLKDFFTQSVYFKEPTQQLLRTLTMFGSNYLQYVKQYNNMIDTDLMRTFQEAALWALKQSLIRLNFDIQIYQFCTELLKIECSLFDEEDEELLSLLLIHAQEPVCIELIGMVVSTLPNLRPTIFGALIGLCRQTNTDSEVLSSIIHILFTIMDQAMNHQRATMIELFEQTVQVDQLLQVVGLLRDDNTFQKLLWILIDNSMVEKRYLPVLEQIEKRGSRIISQLVARIDLYSAHTD